MKWLFAFADFLTVPFFVRIFLFRPPRWRRARPNGGGGRGRVSPGQAAFFIYLFLFFGNAHAGQSHHPVSPMVATDGEGSGSCCRGVRAQV